MTIDELLGLPLEELEKLVQDPQKLQEWGAPYLKVTRFDSEEHKARKLEASKKGEIISKDSLAVSRKTSNYQKQKAMDIAKQFGLKLDL